MGDARHRRRREGAADADQQHLARLAVPAYQEDHGGSGVRVRREEEKTGRQEVPSRLLVFPPSRLPVMAFKRALGPFDATMVVIGGIVGAGIFVTPYIVAQRLDTPLLVLGAWVAGGVIALAGAFSYAELGAIFPKAGGQYVYLRDGLHPLAGFLYGWALLLVIETGAIAAVAITFATYALRVARGPDAAVTPLAIASLIVLSIVNYV